MNEEASPLGKRLLRLVEAYCNGAITDEEFAELERRLLVSAAARAFYRRYMNMHIALGDHGENAGKAWIPGGAQKSKRPFSYRMPAVVGIAAGVLIAVALGIFWWQRGQPEQHLPALAALEQSSGNVQITSAAGEVRVIGSGMEIQSGDTIRTHGALSSAVLGFDDGTRLSLAGGTALTFSEGEQKSVVVHGGTLFASVARQPTGKSLLVLTPQDKVEVLGTKFSLKATANETEVAVSEGRIRLTRLSDGKAVEAAAGQRAVSNPQGIAVFVDRPEVPEDWNEDFEDGLPEGWGAGKFATDHLPSGSVGAVRAARVLEQEKVLYSIVTGSAWTQGLFAVHEDTHLHFTFRMQNPRWFNVLLSTRTSTGDPPVFASNYIFDEVPWEKAEPLAWYTLSIPLAQFKRLSGGKQKFAGEVPFQVILSSEEPDRGLTIDRMWVTRGGPMQIEIKAVE
jgi:ferric-dicitrate binding protein FerR (iron transport regulator)